MPTVADIKALSSRFKDVEDTQIYNWIDLAKNAIDPRIPEESQDYAIKLLSASLGWKLLNQEGGNVSSKKLVDISESYFDWSSVADPFLPLYKALLNHLGLGKNRVLFY